MADTTTLHNRRFRTACPGEELPRRTVTVTGPEGCVVWQSEEFEKLCALLGVDYTLPTVALTIVLREGDATVVTQTVLDKPGG